MKFIKATIFLIVSAFCISSSIHAQAREPVPPFPNTIYSSGVKDRTTGLPMPQGNWAFDVQIQNPNDQAIYCKTPNFIAYVDNYLESCDSKSLGIPLSFANQGTGLVLGSNEKIKIFGLGLSERENLENDIFPGGREGLSISTNRLEYCERSPFDGDCGFYCGDKKYGDEWKVTINSNGYKKYYCPKNGIKVETEVFCDDKHKPGDTWEVAVTNGTNHLTCQPSGDINSDVRCTETPRHAKNLKGECVPASCGATPHGEWGNRKEIPLGWYTQRCEYGEWTDERYECNPGNIKDGTTCRAVRSCGTWPHLAQWWVNGACNRTTRTRLAVKVSCNDGEISKPLESKTVACVPCPVGRNCSDQG